jgi:hypothetical protein
VSTVCVLSASAARAARRASAMELTSAMVGTLVALAVAVDLGSLDCWDRLPEPFADAKVEP